jgi:cytochrome c biogenesis protein CcdA
MKMNKQYYRLLLFATLFLALGGMFFRARPVEASSMPDGPVIHILYFYSVDCTHCQAVERDVLKPLEEKYAGSMDVRYLEIGDPTAYELLVRTEEYFGVAPEKRGLPTVVIGDRILIGEDEVRQQLPCLVEKCLAETGADFPPIPGLADALNGTSSPPGGPGVGVEPGGIGVCPPEEVAACEIQAPIWAAYFYQVGCQACSRAEADIRYIRQRYPQLVVEEFNIYEQAALAQWLAERAGRSDLHTPALFIGDYALIGEREITPQNLQALVEKYAATGAEKVWVDFNPETGLAGLVERFRALGPLTVFLAGLVDGLNPCAFATLIFFIAYLAAGGYKGRQVLAVGGAFTGGILLVYLTVGLGLYKLLDLLGSALTVAGRWLYGLTALFCLVLGVLSFMDFLKARKGRIEEMTLRLPDRLKNRARAVVRQGQRMSAYILGAFITGLLISLLELACTGQLYLPTIVFVTSVPALRARAVAYLLLYNLAFILPIGIVFVLTYFGTTSIQLGMFLRKRTAAVKLGTALVFLALAGWLAVSLL